MREEYARPKDRKDNAYRIVRSNKPTWTDDCMSIHCRYRVQDVPGWHASPEYCVPLPRVTIARHDR